MIDRKAEAFRDAFEKRAAADRAVDAARDKLATAEKLLTDCRVAEEAARTALLKEAAGVGE